MVKFNSITNILALNLLMLSTSAMAVNEADFDIREEPVAFNRVAVKNLTPGIGNSMEVETDCGTAQYQIMGSVQVNKAPYFRFSYDVDLVNGSFAVGFLTGNQASWMKNIGHSTSVKDGKIDIENTTEDLIWVVFSNNMSTPTTSNFRINDYKFEIGTPKTALADQERADFKSAIVESVTSNDFNRIDTILRNAVGSPWFNQRGVDWVLELAAYHNQESIIEQMLTREGFVQPSQDCVVSLFKKLKDHQNDAKVATANYLAQQGALPRVLEKIDVNDMLPKAAARGKLALVQGLLGHAPDQLLTDAVKSAAGYGELETFNQLLQHARDHGTFSQQLLNESLKGAVVGYWLDLTADQEKLRRVRNVINEVLNINDGPTQEGIDLAFGIAISSSANQLSGDLRLLQIMLFDRDTRQLRTGLRPSNERIIYHRDQGVFTDANIINFLNSLNL
jgi:hypothetical protein